MLFVFLVLFFPAVDAAVVLGRVGSKFVLSLSAAFPGLWSWDRNHGRLGTRLAPNTPPPAIIECEPVKGPFSNDFLSDRFVDCAIPVSRKASGRSSNKPTRNTSAEALSGGWCRLQWYVLQTPRKYVLDVTSVGQRKYLFEFTSVDQRNYVRSVGLPGHPEHTLIINICQL